jgi:hypothetical protein
VDVEGGELQVLHGASTSLKDGRIDVLQLEWNSASELNYGVPRTEIQSYLTEFGFRLHRATDTGELTTFDEELGKDVFAIRPGLSRDW